MACSQSRDARTHSIAQVLTHTDIPDSVHLRSAVMAGHVQSNLVGADMVSRAVATAA